MAAVNKDISMDNLGVEDACVHLLFPSMMKGEKGEKGERGEPGTSGSSQGGNPLGSITWMLGMIIPPGYESLVSGHTITRTSYPDFFAMYVDTNKIVYATEAEWTYETGLLGHCPRFVLIDTNTIKLPILTAYMRGDTEPSKAWLPGLPNIHGIINSYVNDGKVYASGAFANKYIHTWYMKRDVQQDGVHLAAAVELDASKVNPIYGRAIREVVPRSFSAVPCLKCGY